MFYLTTVSKAPTGTSTYMGGGGYKQLHVFYNINEFKEFIEKVNKSYVIDVIDWYSDCFGGGVVIHDT